MFRQHKILCENKETVHLSLFIRSTNRFRNDEKYILSNRYHDASNHELLITSINTILNV